MTNQEKYAAAFVEVFGAAANELNDNFSKETVEGWDSVHQLNIIALLEESFDVMFDPEDIMEFTSYAKGRQLLAKYNIHIMG